MRNTEPVHPPDRTLVRLGRYEIVQKLGAGGMADVYLAHQPGPFSASKLIVIKRLRSGMLDDGQFVQMFADESRLALRLNHPNVVQTYEAVAEGSDFYLALEFLDGKSLFQVLTHARGEQMPLALHLWVLTQVLSGLHYAHELKEFDGSSMGIVHRDVSPSNVFTTYSGEVKLLDFGIAKSIGASTATREGIIKGKLGYAAPEQCLCKAIDRRTDLFAVGVMLWEAIAGRRRPMGETEASTYQARIQGTELPIDQAVPNAPPALVAICNRALARELEARFQTALEFRQAIERYLQTLAWKNGSEQLQRFMHDQFATDIEAMRQRIDEYFGRSRSMGTGRSTLRGNTGLTSSTFGIEEAPSLQTHGATHALPSWLRQPLARWGIAAAAALTIGVVSWLGSARLSTKDGEAPIPSARADGSSVPGTKLPESAAPQQAAQVTVSLVVSPSRAEVRLDGRQISNPYRAAHGRDAALHHLTASLAGYDSVEQDLFFDRDIEINLLLDPLSQLPRKARWASPAARPPVPRAGAQAARAASPSSATSLAPGDSLRVEKKSQRIDESDPYGH